MNRVQLRRTKGWRIPAGTVKVDRSTPWGNPFVVGEHRVKTRADAVRLFAYMLDGLICVSAGPPIAVQIAYGKHFRRQGWRLRQATGLGCWCPDGAPCHAQALIEYLVLRDPAATDEQRAAAEAALQRMVSLGASPLVLVAA